MSLDIGEIGVRVNVRDPNEAQQAPAAGCGGTPAPGLTPTLQADMVEQCVRQVLQALRMEGAR